MTNVHTPDVGDGHLSQAIHAGRVWYALHAKEYWLKCGAENVAEVLKPLATPELLETIATIEKQYRDLADKAHDARFNGTWSGLIDNCRTCGTGRNWWRKNHDAWVCPNCNNDPLAELVMSKTRGSSVDAESLLAAGVAAVNADVPKHCPPHLKHLYEKLPAEQIKEYQALVSRGLLSKTDVVPIKHRASYLTVSQQYNLNVACRPLACLGYGTFHVGSSLTKPDYHDVDLRCIMADDEYDAMFGDEHKLKFLNAAVSEWIQARTGLPIDFQFQRATEANAEFTGRRHAVGIVTP